MANNVILLLVEFVVTGVVTTQFFQYQIFKLPKSDEKIWDVVWGGQGRGYRDIRLAADDSAILIKHNQNIKDSNIGNSDILKHYLIK